MTSRRWYIFILPLLLALPMQASAEESDEVGIWSEIGIEKAITRKWDAGVDLDYRAQNKARFSAGFSTSYKPWKFLKLGIGYNFLYTQRPDKYKEKSSKEEDPDNYSVGYNLTPEYWFPRHRFSVEATGSVKLWRWLKLSLRERYQLTHCKTRYVNKYEYRQGYTTKWVDIEDPDDPWNWEMVEIKDVPDGEPTGTWETEEKPSYTDQVLRSRIKLEMDKKKCHFSPFISAEFHNSVSTGDHMLLQKVRVGAGCGYRFRKHHELTLSYITTFYMYDIEADEVVRQDERRHAISLGYKFSF